MPNFSPYANYGYLSLIKESTAGTAVTPTNYLRLISENIVPNFGVSPVQEISGDRERNIRSIQNNVEIGGDVEFFVEPKMVGHFLRSLFGAPTTQTLTAATAFRHTFLVSDTPLTYTFDIKPANAPWVHRYFGVYVTKLSFEPEENKLKCTATLMPRKAFIQARVTTAASSGTSLDLDQTSGLTTSDTIIVLQKEDGYTTIAEYTIAAVNSETNLTVSTISDTLEVGDIVVIKKATESYDQDKVLTWNGGAAVFTGDDIDNTSNENKEEFSLEYNNEVEARFFGGLDESARFPGDIITKGYFASGQLTKYYDDQLNLDKLRKSTKVGIRVKFEGETALESNSSQKARTYWGTGNGFYVEASTAGQDGNDINVTIVIAADDNLAVSKSGNNILISLANTTASKNTGTLIAAAVNALSGVDSVAEGTGAEQFTAAVDNTNLGDAISGATAPVVGRDANQVPSIWFEHADAKMDPFFPSASEDDVLVEEIPFTFYKDTESGNQAKKISTRIRLVNDVSSY